MKTADKIKTINPFTALIYNFSWNKDIKLAYDLFHLYPLLILRNNDPVSIQRLKALSKSFGDLFAFSNKPSSEASKNLGSYHVDKEFEVVRVSNTTDKSGITNGALGDEFINWHSDFSHMDTDFHGSVLYNKKNGDQAITSFCHTSEIFSFLPREEYMQLKRSFGYHSLHSRVYKMNSLVHKKLVKFRKHKTGNMQHEVCKPIIIKTFRNNEAFYLSPATLTRIDNGLKPSKYIRLIEKTDHYHHLWKPYDILIYDNISLLHKRSSFSGKRILYRINFNYKKIHSDLNDLQVI